MIPKRIVLDTNVCLDLFVFRDPRWNALLAGLRDGSVTAITREDCRREWQIVLGYPHLPLDEAGRAAAAAEFDSLLTVLPLPPADADTHRLPVCKDRDDQKFLETARQAGAEALVTKDKALLKLARRAARAGLFAILTPDAWLASCPAPAPPGDASQEDIPPPR